jgi:phosphoadenosine phosphosulfate reductase
MTLNKEAAALAAIASYADKSVAVSFSGGKDSLVVLDLSERVGIERAVFCNTTIEFEETIGYVKQIREYYNIKIDIIEPPISFYEMIRHVGPPSRRSRWCCDVFKFGPLAKYAQKNRLKAYITGLRSDESNRRANYIPIDRNPLIPIPQINPILNWDTEDVWNYIRIYNLPYNPLYKHLGRIGCWCCPYKTDHEWEILEKVFPHKIEELEEILIEYAKKKKIKDIEKFVKGRGWTAWVSPIKKRTIGAYSPCQGKSEFIDLIFNGEDEKQVRRIVKILPILTTDYFLFGKKLRIRIRDIDQKKLNILVEKAINCVNCGACISLCESDALFLDGESLCVDKSKCIQCGKCINTHILRGGCIMRNYSSKRQALITL